MTSEKLNAFAFIAIESEILQSLSMNEVTNELLFLKFKKNGFLCFARALTAACGGCLNRVGVNSALK